MFRYLKELFSYRELLWVLTEREIKVRYKQTILGAVWAIIQPFLLMIIFIIVFGFFLKLKTDGAPYPIFYYSGLLPWTFFSTALTFGSMALVNNSNLITKVYFPRESLPFATLGAALIDFLIAGIIFTGLLFFYKTHLTVNLIYVIPILMLEILFTAAMILLSSALNVLWRDVKFIIPLLLQIWMLASPVVYPLSQVPKNLQFVYKLNPMATVIENFRLVTVLGKSPNWSDLFWSFIIISILFWISYKFFKIKERVFADVI